MTPERTTTSRSPCRSLKPWLAFASHCAIGAALEGLDPDKIEVGRLLIDLDAHQAVIGGEPIDLTRKELELLIVLARNADRTVPRQVLLEEIWGSDQTLNNLRYHISQIRRKFAPHEGAPHLGMRRGIGYYLSSEEVSR